jgi:outer membrane protein assembly factor BamB
MRRVAFAIAAFLVLLTVTASAENWPAFRGAAGGVGHGPTPTTWDVAKSVNVAWTTPIPGLAISSPIVWDDRLYVTTAVPLAPPRARDFRTRHVWKLLSIDRATGKLVWSFLAKIAYGAASPAIAGDVVISSAGDDVHALRASSSGTASVVWNAQGGGAYIPSPLILGDTLFVLNDNGVVTAFDVRSGRKVSQQRAVAGEYCASPVSADGKIYVFSRTGDATVLRAAPTLDVIARNQMGEATQATPAIADGTLYVRTAGHLIALREPGTRGRLP